MIIKEKKHRLNKNSYIGRVVASFTICLEKRKNYFVQKEIVNNFLDILRESISKYGCRNWLYIFMPDHVHLVLEGRSEKSDLCKAVNFFKQKTGFWLSKNKIEIKWQKDFYDHIHRKEEELKKHIFYILNNPIRKGLVYKWEDYPFKGSLDFDLQEIVL